MIVNRNLRVNFLLIITFLLAFVLMLLPQPGWALYAKPQWVFIVLLFWLIHTPKKVGPLFSWCVGMYYDLLMGDVMGAHALVFVLFAYFIQRFLRAIQAIPLWQQMIGIGLCSLISLGFEFLIVTFQHALLFSWHMLWPVVANMIVWPWLYFLFRDVKPKHDYRLLHS